MRKILLFCISALLLSACGGGVKSWSESKSLSEWMQSGSKKEDAAPAEVKKAEAVKEPSETEKSSGWKRWVGSKNLKEWMGSDEKVEATEEAEAQVEEKAEPAEEVSEKPSFWKRWVGAKSLKDLNSSASDAPEAEASAEPEAKPEPVKKEVTEKPAVRTVKKAEPLKAKAVKPEPKKAAVVASVPVAAPKVSVSLSAKDQYDKAYKQYLEGDYRSALASIDLLLKKYPKSVYKSDALSLKGDCHSALGNHTEALRYYKESALQ